MASLVADYSDSEDEYANEVYAADAKIKVEIKEEIEEDTTTSIPSDSRIKTEIKQEIKEEIEEESTTLISSTSNFFTASDNVSDEEDVVDVKKETTSLKVKKEKPSKLPSLSEVNPGVIGSSVFVNPFERAEQAKNSILEKHVRLTEAAPKKPANQPVCWKFKKGRCHMGKNCRFFHAVDNLSTEESNNPYFNDKNSSCASSNGNNIVNRSPYHPVAYIDARRRPLEVEPEDEDSYMAGGRKKKRYGINDRLLPPKKAFDALMEMRKKERPWTMPGAPN